MMRNLILICMVFISFQISQAAASDQINDQTIEQFLSKARSCIGLQNGSLALGVLGFADEERRVSKKNQTAIHHRIENLLQTDRSNLGPVAQLKRILERVSAEGKFNQDNVAVEIRKAHDVDVYIYFQIEESSRNQIKLYLIGIAKKEGCQVTSSLLSFNVSKAPDILDFNKVAKTELGRIFQKAKFSTVEIEKFEAEKGYFSACSDVLTDKLEQVTHEISLGPNNTIRGSNFKITRAGQNEGSAKSDQNDIVKIKGSFGKDKWGPWVALELQQGNNNLGNVPKTYISNLYCDLKLQNLLNYMISGAKSNDQRLSISTPLRKVRSGKDEVDFVIWSKNETNLYCWVIDGRDRTGFILLPLPKNENSSAIAKGSHKKYPTDFGFLPQKFEGEGDNLFACFAPKKAMPKEVHQLWLDKWGANGDGPDGALSEKEILQILDKTRSVSGITEAFSLVTVY